MSKSGSVDFRRIDFEIHSQENRLLKIRLIDNDLHYEIIKTLRF